jgi:molybdenum ABC transporter molybdate-binding protein
MKRLLATLLLLCPLAAAAAEKVSIAAAANLAYAMDALNAGFRQANPGVEVTVLTGASGSLVTQIENGSPNDVFLSADMDFPRRLIQAGYADEASLTDFAVGRLVLWTTRPGLELTTIAAAVRSPAVQQLAVANPATAPYGTAAMQALAKLRLQAEAQPKIVTGENITQTAQFVDTGNADAGFVALSLVLSPRLAGRGRWIEVPPGLYAPLEQGAVLTKRGRDNPAARRYLAFLRGPAAGEILNRFGYRVPLAAYGTHTTDIEYAKVGGESIKLDAFVPNGPGQFPTAILVHGGGWNAGDKSGGFSKGYTSPMDEPLARAGFAWFEINYRLTPRHPYPACIDDVETAIRWVKAHAAEYHVDPRRIALVGESAGGHLVDLAGTRADESTRVAAVVSFYGVYDLLGLAKERGGLNSTQNVSLARLLGSSELNAKTSDILWSASAASHLRPGLPPFLLVHGDHDQSVPYHQSVDFHAKLVALGVPCDFITIPGGVHGMISWDQVAPDYKAQVVAWLQRTLKSD